MPERRRSGAVLPLLVALAAAVALVVVLVGSGDDRPAAEVDRADAVDRGQESTASRPAGRWWPWGSSSWPAAASPCP